jgi:hypothetical protein
VDVLLSVTKQPSNKFYHRNLAVVSSVNMNYEILSIDAMEAFWKSWLQAYAY